MIVGILVSVFAGFLAYGIVYLAGDENQGLSILLGLVTSGVALIGIWLWVGTASRLPSNLSRR